MPKKYKTIIKCRSAITGAYVTRAYAQRNPKTTVCEETKVLIKK